MNYRTIANLNSSLAHLSTHLPTDIDLIVGIPRSGMLVASVLSLYLHKPCIDFHTLLNDKCPESTSKQASVIKKLLVVDDSIASGNSIIQVKKELQSHSISCQVLFCAVYVAPGKTHLVDFYAEVVALPRYFQWNIFNHTMLGNSCFDIDGVLCVDPEPHQNDDGEQYIAFLNHAPPLYVPGCQLGALVTSRLEKYRRETEAWLLAHKVNYKELIMMDMPTMQARQQANNHASFKAGVYKHTVYNLFVESSYIQAVEINRITRKPVFCTENFEMIYNRQSLIYDIKSGRLLPFLRKFALLMRDRLQK